MKIALSISLLCILAVGCSKPTSQITGKKLSSQCIEEGELISVKILDYSLLDRPNSYSQMPVSEGRVEVYHNFIIVTTKDEISNVITHDRYLDLKYKKK